MICILVSALALIFSMNWDKTFHLSESQICHIE